MIATQLGWVSAECHMAYLSLNDSPAKKSFSSRVQLNS